MNNNRGKNNFYCMLAISDFLCQVSSQDTSENQKAPGCQSSAH